MAKVELGKHPELLETYPKQDPDSVLAYLTAKFVKMFPTLPDLVPFQESLKVSCEQQAIPNREAVDRMIRYEAAAERNLSKALDRLETLQRRRKGEAPPPRLNVNLS